jgi:hypothetical protein
MNHRVTASFAFALVMLELLLPMASQAGGTRSIRVTTYQEFAEGQEQGVQITSLGNVHSGWSTTRIELPQLGDDAIRAFATAPDRSVFVGTGGEAPSIHIFQGGKLRKLAKLPTTTWVSALAVRSTQAGPHVLAATVADGRIFDVAPDGKVELWAQVEAEHIWGLVRDGQTTLVATAPGRLLLIDDRDCGPGRPVGTKTRSRTLFESPAKHFLSLHRGG